MTSFNHYALGAVVDWLHRRVAGLTAARARLCTSYGMAESAWSWEAGQLTLAVIIPPNTAGSVALPGRDRDPLEVGPGQHSWTYAYKLPEAAPIDPAARLDPGQEMFAVLRALLQDYPPSIAARLTANSMMGAGVDKTLREIIASVPAGATVLEHLRASERTA